LCGFVEEELPDSLDDTAGGVAQVDAVAVVDVIGAAGAVD